MDGKEKSSQYATNKIKLKKALAAGFWVEAVCIEYSMMEDRAESVLRHAGNIKLTDSQGRPLKLKTKLNKIRSCSAFADKRIRKYISIELVDQLDAWRNERNDMIHAMIEKPKTEDELRITAQQGKALLDLFDNRVRSANKIFDKKLIART